MLIGIDDTDSADLGGCTTYVAALLCEKIRIVDYPRLIRLNPNIPFKTRGNGAVCLVAKGNYEEVKKIVLETVELNSKFSDKRTNPGVVFIKNLDAKKKKILKNFYKHTVSELATIKEAEEVAKKVDAEIYEFKNGRGIIGALGAIGADLSKDKTYELLSYRIPRNCKNKKRKVNEKSVFLMDKKMYPSTFDNIDHETGEIRILPHGPDPVFSGIRGETSNAVKKAWRLVKPLEKIERIQIFETNQATDSHLRKKKDITEIKKYDCLIVEGRVSKNPKNIQGGHVIFEISDTAKKKIKCAAYEPSGSFRKIIRQLIVGDKIVAYGGIVKYKNTINLEKIKILVLEKIQKRIVPKCCGVNMKSAGKDKGFKCKKCSKRVRTVKIRSIKRKIKTGFYEVDVSARRHLAKPLIRMRR